MVDFNNETTVSTPSNDIQRVLILQRKNDLIEAAERYRAIAKQQGPNIQTDISIVHARTWSFFKEICSLLKRSVPKEEYALLKQKMDSDHFDDLEEAFYYMSDFLDDKRLTRIDTRKKYDTRMVTEEDDAHGL